MSRPTSVSIRELKMRLSHYLRLTRAGETVEITDRGVPIGRIVPTALPLEDRLHAMAASGMLAWNGKPLRSRKPRAKSRRRSVSDLLLEDRG